MSAGDAHVAGPDGWPLCGSNSPLRGYNATSQLCRDCDALERPAQRWTVASAVPHFNAHRAAPALLRKRPIRLSRSV
jgi:hypothetical protein